MAFFAHAQQEPKAESVNVRAQILISRAENLPKADLMGKSDPYVTLSIIDGRSSIAQGRTRARRSFGSKTTFGSRCPLELESSLDKLPESARVDFEIYKVGATCCSKNTLIARCSVPVDEVRSRIAKDPYDAKVPKPIKLFAPEGEGSHQRLKHATLTVGFEQLDATTLECLVHTAQGMPVQMGQKIYVYVAVRTGTTTTAGSIMRFVATEVRAKTKIIMRDLNPTWNEVLEVEVPAIHRDHRLEYGSDLVCHFEVFDYDKISADDLLATLDIPLSVLLEHDSQDIRPFELTLAPGFKPKKSKIPKRVSQAYAQAGYQTGPTLRQVARADDGIPRLHLGFQLITPCPLQLQCTVEHASGVVPMPAESAPVARIRLVEGNPTLASATYRRTGTLLRTTNPVWNERCALPVPEAYINFCARRDVMADRAGDAPVDASECGDAPPNASPQVIKKVSEGPVPASVRAGWEHQSDSDPQLFLCAEIFDKNLNGNDTPMGHCTIPLDKVITGVRQGHFESPQCFDLSTGSHLYLAFSFGDGADLIVKVDRAEKLHPNGDISADPYCVVNIAEVGAFKQATSQVLHKGIVYDTNLAEQNPTDPVWNQDMLIDLPGAWNSGGKVAMRSNWFAHIQVLEVDHWIHKEVPIMEAALPLTTVLSELADQDMLRRDPGIIRSRIDALRWGQYTEKKVEAFVPRDVQKDIELAIVRRPVKKSARDKDEKKHSDELSSSQLTDSTGRMQPASPEDMSSTVLGTSPTPSSPQQHLQRSNKGTLFGAVRSLPQSLSSGLSAKPDVELEPEATMGTLRVRFQIVSRWQGLGRDRTKPLAKAMTKASPVTQMIVLSTRLVAGYENGNVFVWDAAGTAPVPLHRFEAHGVPISGLAYLPHTDLLVTAAFPKTREEAVLESVVRMWDMASFECRQTLSMHSASTRCIAAITPSSLSKKKTPCLVLGTETLQSKLLQTLRYAAVDARRFPHL
jgi:hypothetical protein